MDAAHTAQRRGTLFEVVGSTPPTGMNTEEKRRARTRLRALRRALLPEDVVARGARVQARLLSTPHYQKARTLALYAALPGEVPTQDVLAAAVRDGKTVVFPVVPDTGKRLVFRSVEAEAHLDAAGHLAIPEPSRGRPEVALADIDLFVVPGLGFSRKGHRLGRGAGYYDATLALAPAGTPRVGLAFSEQVLETLPVDEDDVAMHLVVTEKDTFAAPEASATVVTARSK